MTTNTKNNSMITSIIFSKNRPLQLDLCLSSIAKNFPDSSQIIVIHNNDSTFDEAHNVLCQEHNHIESWKQSSSIFSDVFVAALGAKNDYICFFTDDNIVYDEFICGDYSFLHDPHVSCLSLRMGMNIVERSHDGVTDRDMCQKMFKAENNMIVWPKTWNLYGSYWSYDLSVDGHVFRQEDMISMMDELCFLQSRYNWENTPNVLESEIQRFWPIRGNYIIAPKHSVVVNSPNNRVSDTHTENVSGQIYDYDEQTLLNTYLSGTRIYLENLNIGNIKCPHTELDILNGIIK